MKFRNLISVYQGDAAIESSGTDTDKHFTVLKKHEIRNMQSFCEAMMCEGCSVGHFDSFYVSYTIAQIGKEFDLLRFGTEYILNIEIKSELKVARKEQKIQEQMRKNHYYLNFLGKPLKYILLWRMMASTNMTVKIIILKQFHLKSLLRY